MKTLRATFLTVFLILSVGVNFALYADKAEEFRFRDSHRPVFENTLSVSELETLQSETDVLVLDVRLLEDFEVSSSLIPGAVYKNPDDIVLWAETLPANANVVVYCVAGKWISQKAATYLAQKGIAVRSLEGGIRAWRKSAHADDAEKEGERNAEGHK